MPIRARLGEPTARRRRILRDPHPAGAGREVLRVPFGRREGPARRPAARYGRATACRRRLRPGRRAATSRAKACSFRRCATNRYEMPPTGKLPDAVIDDFEKWIALGAPDPRDEAHAGRSVTATQGCRPARSLGLSATAAHRRRPKCKNAAWPRTDVDRFVLAKLEAAGFTPSPQAAPRVLLRRLYYDLIGLPPTAEELDEFAADPSDARYEAAVDRLLASPRFGERWARHWLDVARYADTKGYVFEEDRNYKHAYTYRDWVIASFNADRPFDEFIVAQLAADQIDDPIVRPGDRLPHARPPVSQRSARHHQRPHRRRDARPAWASPSPAPAATITSTIRSARPTTTRCTACSPVREEKPRDDAPPQLVDADKPYEPFVFLRGNPGNRGPKVDRRFLTCLTADGKPAAVQARQRPARNGRGDRQPRQPAHRPRLGQPRVGPSVRARAWSTRRAISASAAHPPTHPELLDWLACDSWTTAGRPSGSSAASCFRAPIANRATTRPECVAVDAENHLLWRANRRRLDLEALRDSLLVAAGRLDETMGGPSCRSPTRRSPRAARVRFHRTPKPAGVLPHVRLRQPEHAHARAAANRVAAAGAVSDEQPVRDRASDAPGSSAARPRVAGIEPQASRQTPATLPQPRPPHQSTCSASRSAAKPPSTN